MGWLASVLALIIAFAAFSSGSFIGGILGSIAALLVLPPLWKRVRSRGLVDPKGLRWCGALFGFLAATVLGSQSYADSPAGQAAKARREATAAEQLRLVKAEQTNNSAKKEAELASGEHCLSGWDGSFPDLKRAIKVSLRNPSSFEHVETVRSPVDRNGKFGLVMTFRAENGFGGMNVEAAAVEIEARTCRWEQVTAERVARRLQD